MNKKKSCILWVSAVILLPLPFAVSAFGPVTHFGGKIKSVSYCTCPGDPATILTIDDYASGDTIKLKYALFYSTRRAYLGVFRQGMYTRGGAMSGDTFCRQVSSTGCTTGSETDSDAVVDITRGIGTSRF